MVATRIVSDVLIPEPKRDHEMEQEREPDRAE
jgi:hypothetical protein